jgi:transcriptional regulator with XRE-family HTH domain
MDVSKNIIRIREAKRIKQSEVAEKLNMERPNYSRIEKRGLKMSLEQLFQIADALDVSFYDLLADAEGRVIQPFIDVLKEENKKLLVKLIDVEDDKRRLKKEIKGLEEELTETNKMFARNESDYIRQASLIMIPIIFKKFKEIVKTESAKKSKVSDKVYSIFEELISMDKNLFDLPCQIRRDWDINESHITSLMSSEKLLIKILNTNKEENDRDLILLFKEQYFKFLPQFVEKEFEEFDKDFDAMMNNVDI